MLEVDAEDLVTRGDMPPDIPYHVVVATDLADKSKAGAALTKAAVAKAKEKRKPHADKRQELETHNPLAKPAGTAAVHGGEALFQTTMAFEVEGATQSGKEESTVDQDAASAVAVGDADSV